MSQQDAQRAERFLTVEPPECQEYTGENPADAPIPVPTHITLHPPSDNKKRAVEKFAFTKVFEETSSQLELFQDTQMDSLLSGVLLEGRDGLVATLGVTGSGKVCAYNGHRVLVRAVLNNPHCRATRCSGLSQREELSKWASTLFISRCLEPQNPRIRRILPCLLLYPRRTRPSPNCFQRTHLSKPFMAIRVLIVAEIREPKPQLLGPKLP